MSRSTIGLAGMAPATLVAVLVGVVAPLRGWAPIMSAQAATSPKATCQPGDRTETGLQGQVPLVDRITGRAAQGYNCNLTLVGSYGDPVDVSHLSQAGWATLDVYKNCAYFGNSGNGIVDPTRAAIPGGVDVVDISDPAHPVRTDLLTTAAMQDPWESLRVNNRRGLLVADHSEVEADSRGASPLDIYDVSSDCRHPKLLFSGNMPTAVGHEGFFQPDGMVYYVSGGNTLVPVDISDPRHPVEMNPNFLPGTTHGFSISQDGTRGYLCDTGTPNSVRIIDTSDVQARRPNPIARLVSSVPIPDNAFCQAAYPLTYGTHRYVVQYGENAANKCPSTSLPFAAPHIIDLADEFHPKVVSVLTMEVDDPANCSAVMGDVSLRSVGFAPIAGGGGSLFGYDVHHCSPDRLQDPTILACGTFLTGLRVWDIRDPANPRELAYYSKGTISLTDQTVDDAISRAVVLTDRREIVWTTEFSGLHISKFEGSLWPFNSSVACNDYFFVQYNPSSCPPVPASSAGIATGGSGSTTPNTSASGDRFAWPVVPGLLGAAALSGRRRRRG